ncbi:unnamed protein product, partial [Iphiclides podalirius]
MHNVCTATNFRARFELRLPIECPDALRCIRVPVAAAAAVSPCAVASRAPSPTPTTPCPSHACAPCKSHHLPPFPRPPTPLHPQREEAVRCTACNSSSVARRTGCHAKYAKPLASSHNVMPLHILLYSAINTYDVLYHSLT